MNFRTQIYFGTSVREDGTEFGVLHCRFSKYHEILCNQILQKLFEACKGGTSWTYGIHLMWSTEILEPLQKRITQIAHFKVEKKKKKKIFKKIGWFITLCLTQNELPNCGDYIW